MAITIIISTVVLLLSAVAALAAYLWFLWSRSGACFESDGLRLHYVEKGTGTPVILVHGFAITLGGNWFLPHIFQRLAREYRVIAFDNRGHGRSTRFYKPEDYGTRFVEDIIRLMDHLNIEKAHVIGYSLGGFITLKLIEMYPERLLSAAPCGAGWTQDPEKELVISEKIATSLEGGTGFLPLLEWLEPPGKPKRKRMIAVINAFMCWLFDVKAMAAIMRSFHQLMVSEEALRANKVPALAIVGGKDPFCKFAKQLAEVTSNLELVIVPNGDHGTTVISGKTIRALRKFLEEHTPSD
ncbi:MAG TPA: alpha/beta hydrolase [Candidatus Hydrogenedentes bacterium]|nr:alpha/beta hydrolase [Candidatus Hydrogenedentota bacterium]